MKKIIVITGPTGVGKTKLSVELAKRLNGEIINADSMQVYKEMNIGTAKITEEEKEGIPHHLFNIKSVKEEYSIYEYQKAVRDKIKELEEKNITPILVGGSGLYIKAALYDYKLEEEIMMNMDLSELSNEHLYDSLENKSIHINNRRRLERAYQKQIKGTKTETERSKLIYDAIFVGLTNDRKELYEKINNRVDTMFKEGLEKEAKDLFDQNINSQALLTAIGYKELFKYFDNKITLEESKELIKRNSRRYAKRQYTWFNNQMDINWFEVNYNRFSDTIDEVVKYIEEVE